MLQIILTFIYNKYLEWRYKSMIRELINWKIKPRKNNTFNSSSIINCFRTDKRFIDFKNKRNWM